MSSETFWREKYFNDLVKDQVRLMLIQQLLMDRKDKKINENQSKMISGQLMKYFG